MKRFHELNKSQQEQAVAFARQELRELINNGVICSNRPLTKEDEYEFATCAAEEAFYSEKTDKVVEGIIE
jgi:hypothetical protein